MVIEIEMSESPDLTPLDFCLWGWMMGKVYKKKGRNTIRTAHSHVYAAACIKKRQDELRRTARYRQTRVTKCTEFDGEIFEHLL